MNNIDDIIKTVKQNDIEIPTKIQNRINYTLKNKKREKYLLKKLVTATVSVLCVMLGTFGVYAVTGGTIEGIPATDWLGIKFSNKYVEYKQPVENQKIVFEDTSVELVSTLCNDGITILEFNMKLSEEDYKKLQIDESIITDEYIQKQEEYKERKFKEIEANRVKGNDLLPSEEELIEQEVNAQKEKISKEIEEEIENRRNTKFIPALCLNYKQKGGVYNYDVFNPDTVWYASIFIDDEPYYVRNWERIEKISDYEYKIYVMYMLTDDVLNEKEDFKITLKNNKLVNFIKWNSLDGNWRNDCQLFASENNFTNSTASIVSIDLPGEFEINVSKDDVLKDSVVMENLDIKSEFRNITHKVEKVVASPIQTVVRINHSATQQSSNAFANVYSNPNIEHLPLTRKYKVYDANNNELSCFRTSNKNTLIYADGTREDYDYHDIPNKKYSNATWENIEYLLIENTDTEYIKIVPVEVIRNPVDGTKGNGGEIEYEMDPLIINLK